MASWVLSISEKLPQHWGYAVRHGMWDLRSPRAVRTGDLVYFWQSGSKGGWVGRAPSTDDAYPIDATARTPGPWDDWPGDPPYRSRLAMDVIDATAASDVTWSQVRSDLGVAINPGWKYPFSAAQEAVLASYFATAGLTPEQSMDDARREKVFSDLSEDLRVRTLQLIDLRQGQPAFRKELIRAYKGTCAVTGTAMERVMEAAHISPYKGAHTNDVTNGLLLRADIHTLFDLHLLTVTDQHLIRVAPEIGVKDYARLDGLPLKHVPSTLTDQPDADRLHGHNEHCAWLTP